MDRRTKFDIVVDAIANAKALNPYQYFLDRTPENGLQQLYNSDIYPAFKQLRDVEKVISIRLPSDPVLKKNVKILRINGVVIGNKPAQSDPPKEAPPKHEFIFSKSDLFKNWYEGRLLKRKDNFADLSPLNQDKIWITLQDIEEKLQMLGSDQLSIPLFFNHTTTLIPSNGATGGFRLDALEFLKNKQIVFFYRVNQNGLATTVTIHLNIEKYRGFTKIVKQIIDSREPAPASPTSPLPSKKSNPKFDLRSAIERFNKLSVVNKEKVWITVRDIEESLEACPDVIRVEIPLFFYRRTKRLPDLVKAGPARKDALLVLMQAKAIVLFSIEKRGEETYAEVSLFNDDFDAFKNEMDKIFKPDEPENQTDHDKPELSADEVAYKITYTPAREVLVNNFSLGKPDFAGENDTVFRYLLKHPNKIIDIKELESVLGEKLKKELRKVVENLGFSRELKALFFSVSNKSIMFRNPITRQYMRENNIPPLKLPLN